MGAYIAGETARRRVVVGASGEGGAAPPPATAATSTTRTTTGTPDKGKAKAPPPAYGSSPGAYVPPRRRAAPAKAKGKGGDATGAGPGPSNRPAGPSNRPATKVGELTVAARSILDRIHGRWSALKRDVVNHADVGDWRTEFLAAFDRWGTFYQAAIQDWAIWSPADVTSAEHYDRELDRWRAEYPDHAGGRAPTTSVTSATTRNPDPDPTGLRGATEGISRGVRAAAWGVAALAAAWGLSSLVKLKG